MKTECNLSTYQLLEVYRESIVVGLPDYDENSDSDDEFEDSLTPIPLVNVDPVNPPFEYVTAITLYSAPKSDHAIPHL